MATYTPEQIKDIIIRNPNKKLLEGAQATRKKLMMHLYGQGMSECLERMEYFENEDIHKARRRYAISNKDFFSRILNEEDQVFTALGGSVNYSMPDSLEKQMNGLTDDVSYGISLHNWVKEFGLKAYRADPMGVIFMEREAIAVSETGMVGPKCYPTYKASSDIYDYLPIGRKLEHVCFQLTPAQLQEFGISDENYKNVSGAGLYHTQTPYFRFVDDAQDTIFKRDGDSITIVESPVIAQKNPIENTWSRVPAFIASDLIKFDEPTCFASAVEAIVELADTFLYDRSIRDLQKKYHGFAKVVEPLLPCGTCHGTGLIKGDPCPSCSMPGAEKGTGYKLRTTVGDVAKFPIKILEDVPGFDFNRIFGYITPDIESWNKQDTSLEALEAMAYVTYWGVNNTKITGANGKNGEETATKTLANLQPKYARLNCTADWAEKTEKMIADFIGEFWFESQWKGANIRYGRNYILETPDEIMKAYQDMATKAAPDSVKDEQMRKYIRALYQSNPIHQAKFLKLFSVEPFPHNKPQEIEASPVISMIDKVCKRYYGEWVETLSEIEIITMDEKRLRDGLIAFGQLKLAPLQEEIKQQQEQEQNQKVKAAA